VHRRKYAAVRRLTTVATIFAVFLALVYAPLFHVHAETLGGGGPVLHAHLDTRDVDDDDNEIPTPGPKLSAQHAHGKAQQVDVLTVSQTQRVAMVSVASTVSLYSHTQLRCAGFVTIDSPFAHAPPCSLNRIPRSPPTT
jgi:uncharacterized protein YxeA